MRVVGRALTIGLILLAIGACAGAVAPASADSLCAANEAPCGSTNLVSPKTVLKAEIKSGDFFTFSGFADKVTCEKSMATYEVKENRLNGGKGAPVVVAPLSETFENCTSSLLGTCSSFAGSKLVSASKWAANASVPGDGYAPFPPAGATKLVYFCGNGGAFCEYEISSAEGTTHVHTFLGGSPAKERWEDTFKFSGGTGQLCSLSMKTSGQRSFVSPSTLYWTLG